MSHVLSKEHLFVVAGDLAGKSSGKLEISISNRWRIDSAARTPNLGERQSFRLLTLASAHDRRLSADDGPELLVRSRDAEFWERQKARLQMTAGQLSGFHVPPLGRG
jgi:hypothetical protein